MKFIYPLSKTKLSERSQTPIKLKKTFPSRLLIDRIRIDTLSNFFIARKDKLHTLSYSILRKSKQFGKNLCFKPQLSGGLAIILICNTIILVEIMPKTRVDNVSICSTH
jgi:hypothetical protein